MHSTRGRAHPLFEMMRGDELGRGWRSPHVREALDLCLSCKGCKSDCPVSVDMATYKAEFLSHYYRGRLRPPSAYAMGLLQVWAGFAQHAPNLINKLLDSTPFAALARQLGGISQHRDLPCFAPESFARWFERRPSRNGGRPKVVLWTDTFTNHFEPGIARAAVEVLESAGCSVSIPDRPACCGGLLYEYGMLERARRYGRRNLEVLRKYLAAGLPIVVLEPSCLSVFKDEMINLFPDDPDATKLARNTCSLDDFLIERLDYEPSHLPRAAIVHGHCHQKAFGGIDSELKLLHRMGMTTEAPNSGCCGLAGSFGYETTHYDVSMKIGEQVLLPKVREAASDTLIVSSGFSCRQQILHGTGRTAMHPAQVIELALRQQTRRPALRDLNRPKRRMIIAEAAAGIALVAAAAGFAYSRQMQVG
jgi:Fe-S oxidoreductase